MRITPRANQTYSRGYLLAAFVALAVVGTGWARDWTHWRGPEQNGVSRERDLPEKWSPNPEAPDNNLLWKVPYGCRSTPIVMNGRVYIIQDCDTGINEQERVLCFDEQTGKKLWEHRFPIFATDIVSSRVGWTNIAGDPETGNIYAHGVSGLFFCFDKDGKILWDKSLTEEFGRVTGYGGRVTSPIVDGDLVIIGMVNSSWGNHARGHNRFLALDKRTGTPVWWSESAGTLKGTYYSVPVVAVINGQRLLITGGADGYIQAFKVRTGERVWSYQVADVAINASPVVDGNYVYITHGEESPDTSIQGRIACLDAGQIENGQPKLVWKVDGVKAGYASPIVHDGKLYVSNDSARLYCYDAKTGDRLWQYAYGRLARGSPVWADGKIYVADVNAHFHILRPEEKRCVQLHDQFFPGGREIGGFVETNCTPAVVNGKVFFATFYEMFCIGKKDHSAKPDPIPPQAEEKPRNPNAKITHLQLVPAEVTLQPGDSATFTARLFDEDGHFVKETKAEWSLPTPPPPPGSKSSPPPLRGEVGADGKLTTAKDVPMQQGYVLAKADGLTAMARVRVVPPLPLTLDFSKYPTGSAPGGWVYFQGRFSVDELPDGTKALKKLANDARPPLARARSYMNLPHLSNYTIEAELMGTEKRMNLPDHGLINSRYRLVLDGNKQQLRLFSWAALPRIDHSIDFEWKPNTWYHMKFRVEPKGDKNLLLGKVWPMGQSEPKEWTITFEDPMPNREGSPGIYAYATGILADDPGAESYFRNIKVYPNQ
ncbi:MAG: PQQ-binding-like beta-propeller repeat protein [Gemmataceae bacterium]